ncbi:MAG TPA: hypothetical protein VIH57_13825 [Bacteroidales bacterium]
MKAYLQHLVVDLKNFSKSLDKKSILIDKPWALIDSDMEIQKLIFKKNNELIMSKDGQVVIGSWDYLPEARSLLIDRGKDKILCNEGFIDEAVMVLKMDGTKNNFFVLANENIIPDLNVYKYLKELRYRNLNVTIRKLTDGKILEIIQEKTDFGNPRIGNPVTIEAENIPDGAYKIEKSDRKFIIKNSVICDILHEVGYETKTGINIMIEQKDQYYYRSGDNVWVNGVMAPDGEYKIIGRRKIIVKDGKIFKKKIF